MNTWHTVYHVTNPQSQGVKSQGHSVT